MNNCRPNFSCLSVHLFFFSNSRLTTCINTTNINTNRVSNEIITQKGQILDWFSSHLNVTVFAFQLKDLDLQKYKFSHWFPKCLLFVMTRVMMLCVVYAPHT